MTARALIPALLLAAILPAAALADSGDDIQQARQAYVKMDYERVVKLTRGPAADPGLSSPQRVEALELLGLSQLILGRQAQARSAFEALLTLSPDHKLRDPSGSPKLQRFFESVRQEVGATSSPGGSLRITPERPGGGVRAGATLTLRARLSGDPGSGARTMLRWRTSREVTWRGAKMTGGHGRLSARLRLPSGELGYRLLYQIELRSGAGNLLARAGTRDKPLTLEVAPGQARSERPVWKRWWFWTVIGAVVVGGVTAGAVLLSREGAPHGNLEPGVVQLRVRTAPLTW